MCLKKYINDARSHERQIYPEGDVTYKTTDYTIVVRFSAMQPEANKTNTRKTHVIPDAGRADTAAAAAMETTKNNWLP